MSGVRQILPVSIQHGGESSPGPGDEVHTIATKNRWSRIVLRYENLTPDVWCEFSFRIGWNPGEGSRNIYDFATVGVDFLTEDGSSIDFAYIPGLSRAQIDPFNDYVAGPTGTPGSAEAQRHGVAQCSFLVPAPARHALVTIRGWRNTHLFQVIQPRLRQFIQPGSVGAVATEKLITPSKAELDATLDLRRNWKPLGSHPVWYGYAVVPSRRLFVRGQIVTKDIGAEGALARVVFRDARGEEIAPPYPETLSAPTLGAFINIPAHVQARRFTLELIPPPQATKVELGFQTWRSDAAMELVTPLEITLEDDLLLEAIAGDDAPDATAFITKLARQMELLGESAPSSKLIGTLLDRNAPDAPPTVQRRLRAVERGEQKQVRSGALCFEGFPNWALPEEPRWTEDPFRSPAWRLEFHSLIWLLEIARANGPHGFQRAVQLALSWSRSSPWGQPEDALSGHPLALAARTEALVELLAMSYESGSKISADDLLALAGEAIRHGFTLAEIIGQNVFSHSSYQVHAASALLALSKALPRLPLSTYWSSIALARLGDAYDELIGADGKWFEQSQHNRIELVSIGLILSNLLEKVPEAQEFRLRIAQRLKEAALALIVATDPAGVLAATGDTPRNCHHASWLKRLLTQYGQVWLGDKVIRAELSYPQGPRVFSIPQAGTFGVRYFEKGRDWSHLTASISEQKHPHGHFDCTSFVFSSGGVRWIVDSGGSAQHETGSVRHYLTSSRAHNVAIPDGREQTAGTAWLRSATSADGANVFEVSTNVHGPDYVHRRIFICLNDLSAVAVFDHFLTEQRPLSFEGSLHFDPSVMAAIAGPHLAVGFRGRKKLRVRQHVVFGQPDGLGIVQGANNRSPRMQGFVSQAPRALDPASVLRYSFAGERSLCGGIVMALEDVDMRTMLRLVESAPFRAILEQTPSF